MCLLVFIRMRQNVKLQKSCIFIISEWLSSFPKAARVIKRTKSYVLILLFLYSDFSLQFCLIEFNKGVSTISKCRPWKISFMFFQRIGEIYRDKGERILIRSESHILKVKPIFQLERSWLRLHVRQFFVPTK